MSLIGKMQWNPQSQSWGPPDYRLARTMPPISQADPHMIPPLPSAPFPSNPQPLPFVAPSAKAPIINRSINPTMRPPPIVPHDSTGIPPLNSAGPVTRQVFPEVNTQLIRSAVSARLNPQIGQTRQFKNGRIGRWDGRGWEHVSGGQ